MTHLRAPRSNRFRIATLAASALVLALGACASPVLAQAKKMPGVASWSCPAGYHLFDVQPAYCGSSAGDVVEPHAIYRPAAAVECPRGYDKLGSVCLSFQTGDVVLAETESRKQASR